MDLCQQLGDVGVGGRWETVEHGPGGRARARVHAVEDEGVEMNIEIRGTAKALDGRDTAAAGPDQPPPRRAA